MCKVNDEPIVRYDTFMHFIQSLLFKYGEIIIDQGIQELDKAVEVLSKRQDMQSCYLSGKTISLH